MEQFKIINNSIASLNTNLKDFDKKTEVEQIHSSCMAIVDLVVICIYLDSIKKDLQHLANFLVKDIPARKPMLLLPQYTE